MRWWGTRFNNAADDFAPYVGPVVSADSEEDARALIAMLRGPNFERLELIGEIERQLRAEIHGDTKTWYQTGDPYDP